MRLRHPGSQLQGLLAGGLSLLQVGPAGVPPHEQERAAVGGSGKRRSEARVDIYGTGEHPPGELNALLAHQIEGLPPAEIEIVRLDASGSRLIDCALFLLRQHHSQCADDVLCDLVLYGKHILQLPVVTLGPETVSISYIDELHDDPEPVTGLPDTPFQHGTHAELVPDVADVLILPLVGERRRPGGNAKRLNLGQRSDDFLCYTLAEVILILLGAHVCKREDGDGLTG